MNGNVVIGIDGLHKIYGSGDNSSEVLKGINLEVYEGEICIILGPSGSGKSTLMNIIGGLDDATSGNIEVKGKRINNYNQNQMVDYRREYLGFIFQFYNLIPNLTVKENIMVSVKLSKNPIDINTLSENLGLAEHMDKFPFQLSGGQQQRTAIGRALVKNPSILLCDEPTGALDYKTSKEILKLLQVLNEKYNTTILMITHNESLKAMGHRVVYIKDGQVTRNEENDTVLSAQLLEW